MHGKIGTLAAFHGRSSPPETGSRGGDLDEGAVTLHESDEGRS